MKLICPALVLLLVATTFGCATSKSTERLAMVTEISEPQHMQTWIMPPKVNINNYAPGRLAENINVGFAEMYAGYTVYKLAAKGAEADDAIAVDILKFMEANREVNVGSIQAYFKDIYGKDHIPSASEIRKRIDPWIAQGYVISEYEDLVAGVEPNKLYIVIHNGYTPAEDRWLVTTYPSEHEVTIVLKKILRDGSIASVRSIATSVQGDNPISLAYDPSTNELTVCGLMEDTTRVLAIKYDHDSPTKFVLQYQPAENVWKGYVAAPTGAKDWVFISNKEVEVLPYESKAVAISLQTPQGIELPKNWEAQILVSESTESMVTTGMVVRLLITMG